MKKLTPEQEAVCWASATEAPFSGIYNDHYEEGTYYCVACDTPLYSSKAKFKSGCGWPSFSGGLAEGIIEEIEDLTHGMRRVEIKCNNCKSHLGHSFPDGPLPSGIRHCVNSLSLDFTPKD